MRHLAWVVVLGLALPLMPPAPAGAQLSYGGHVVEARDAFGGARGLGARVGVSVPLLPLRAYGTAEYFRPDCGPLDRCGLSGVSLDVNYAILPIPLLSPYLTGGVVARRVHPGPAAADLSGDGEAFSDRGVHLGVGITAGAAGFRLFGEARYEFVRAPERQVVMRIGLLLGS